MTKFERALSLLQSCQYEQARTLLEDLKKEDPHNMHILYNLGMCYTELGDPELAIKTLQECIKWSPSHSNAYVAVGFAYSKLGDPDKAKEFFTKALEIDQDNPYALRNLGGIFGKERNYLKAIEFLKKSFDINPSDQNTTYGLGMTYLELEDIHNADRYLKKTIDMNESTPVARMAKDLRRRIAVGNLKSKGFRTDAMFYCISAIQMFKLMTFEEIRKISFDIALKGQNGLDINDPEKKYTLKSMNGTFSGLQLVSYMYVGFKMIAPEMNAGINLSEEYKMALSLVGSKGTYDTTIN